MVMSESAVFIIEIFTFVGIYAPQVVEDFQDYPNLCVCRAAAHHYRFGGGL
jgi:hypothetical protein